MDNTPDAKRIAAELISAAWQDAAEQGVEPDLFASTALSASLAFLVKTHGRDGAVRVAERLVDAVRAGKFDYERTPPDAEPH